MSTLIGLGHRKGAGNDAHAQILVAEHGFCRLAFADAIKAVLCDLAPLLNRHLGDALAALGMAELGIDEAPVVVPEVREALATLEASMRHHAGPNVWAEALMRRIDEEAERRFVVTDVRFECEVRAIRDRGGLVVRVDRPGIGVSHNTVQLGARSPWNTGPRWASRLRPRLVPLPLHVPLDVLALDDPRVAAMATGRIEPPRQQPDGVAPTVVSVLRGKNRAPLGSSGERCGGRRRS